MTAGSVAFFGAADHSVQFYESSDYLCTLVARFVAEGLRMGEPAVLIATEAHRAGFAAQLRRLGIDPDEAPITMLDARETLSVFMDGDTPNEGRFHMAVGSVLEQRCGGDARIRIRAYGEMVDLLWRDGNPDAALHLEKMWNGLAGFYTFTLLCAYPINNFYKESHSGMFEAICRAHGRVMPTENFCTDANYGREVAILQQRAGALLTEIEHRKELETRLREALAVAAAANRAKDEFLATLSHELRTPLTAILGWTRMLELGGLDPDAVRNAIRTIDRSAHAQAALIDDLLDVSRIVSGKLSLRNDVVDLADVAERAMETMRLAAEARDIGVDLRAVHGEAIVTGDSARLQQIVWNLLSNAVKFSDAGSRVSISIERDEQQASLTVRDSGCGIEPEFLPHVFEPFRQADGTSTRTHAGLGLGLAIVKHVVELHGGSVSAASEGRDQGAVFVVKMPLAG
jgi:signal transduction histidine kinase